MRIDPLFGNTPDNNNKISPQKSVEDNRSIFLSFNDSDGIIDKNDIQFSNDLAEEIVAPYLYFLKSYCDGNHEWTGFMLDTVNLLLESINAAYEDYNGNYKTSVLKDNVVLSDDEGNEVLELVVVKGQIKYLHNYKNSELSEFTENDDGTKTIKK